jgi:hypothetical protein
MTISLALGQSGGSDASLADVGAKLAQSIEFKETFNRYSAKALRTVPTTSASLSSYNRSFASIVGAYDQRHPELELVVTALEQGDLSPLTGLAETKTAYERLARELAAMPVPIGLEREHLEVLNGLSMMATSLGYLAESPDDTINAVAGITLYKMSDARIAAAASALRAYLTRYGIL